MYAVRGSYDDAFELALQASREFGWYNRNTGVNPYTREGKKTAAYEICEQLAAPAPPPPFRAPDAVVVPVGDGNIISGLHKGFKDLLALGWIERMPRFIGVTAALAPALYRAWHRAASASSRRRPRPLPGGISADLPRDGVMALRAVRETGGAWSRRPTRRCSRRWRPGARSRRVRRARQRGGLVGLAQGRRQVPRARR